MSNLTKRLSSANSLLAPYAVPLEGTLCRAHEEPSDETRFPFQRDRDRIIHTRAFRRLQGKTQVFVAGEGDHYRTRLTHTMEVAQISRDIARTLQLNEDLAECIALAHDLGHPPFGHAGEEALNAWMKQWGKHFEHNEQSHRIVTLLEEHSSRALGLNLNKEILDGLLKHTTPFDKPLPSNTDKPLPNADNSMFPALEAQVVNIADEIAYTGHDVDDGLYSGLFSISDLGSVVLVMEAWELRRTRGTSLRGAIIHLLVTDLYQASSQALQINSIATLEQVYASKEPLILFSRAMREKLDALRSSLWDHMYLSPSVLKKSGRGKEIITDLCNRFRRDPPEKVLESQRRFCGTLEEAVKDYIAGMTDAYAASQRSSKLPVRPRPGGQVPIRPRAHGRGASSK